MGQRSVRFPDDLQERADGWAKANDRPFSYVVVKALEQFLAREHDPEMVTVPHRTSASSRQAVETFAAPVQVVGDGSVGRCPKATCSAAGLVGESCPLHPNMRFKVLP